MQNMVFSRKIIKTTLFKKIERFFLRNTRWTRLQKKMVSVESFQSLFCVLHGEPSYKKMLLSVKNYRFLQNEEVFSSGVCDIYKLLTNIFIFLSNGTDLYIKKRKNNMENFWAR